jgi:dTDP-4-dehydrorhamnose reductase
MNGEKILVTGSGGLLGSYLIREFSNSVGYSSQELDITKPLHVRQMVEMVRPDVIIHAAAFTDVEACEVETDKAFEINAIGTQNLVNCCIDKDILFVYISSTGVYGSYKAEGYTEFDKVEPPTIHHKSKYEGEKIVRQHLSKYLIVRTGWLYGGGKEYSKNFVYQRFIEARNKDIIYSDDSQIGNPTYVYDLIGQIEVLIINKQYGIFNCVNAATKVTRFEYVKKIIELCNVSCTVEVSPIGWFNRTAPVSNNESAKNYKLNLLDLNSMPSWEDALKRYIIKEKAFK